jgi:hypothetical protein
MAALFGSKLKGSHRFVDEDIRKIMKRDFEMSETIQLDTEIATASNRIEFYLDTAEKRIRDAVLCGWGYRHGQLERCLELLANGYFIEIVGLLGTFFEGQNGMDSEREGSSVKGLGNKVDLIMTYLQHNDRLATILDHALRPYAMRTKPAATLSLFLDFDILASWYTSVLLLEMRGRVDDVLAVWQDVSKDVTGHSANYKFKVPWIPYRCEVGDDLYFYTCIPEDLVEILLTYLTYARIKKGNVAESFQHSLGRLDSEVLMAYTSSFLSLAEKVQTALASKLWSLAVDEVELEEYSTWLASVANDARRVETNQLYSSKCVTEAVQKQGEEMSGVAEDDAQGRQQEILNKRARVAFSNVMVTALDHLSCIVCVYAFHESRELLTNKLYYVWVERMQSEEPSSPNQVIAKSMEDIKLFVNQMIEFLNHYCYCTLVSIVADKTLILYFTLLKRAQYKGCVFGDLELAQYRHDVSSMKAALLSAMEDVTQCPDYDHPDYDHFQSLIADKFRVLDMCEGLFAHPLFSSDFDVSMNQLLVLAAAQPDSAEALARLIEVCLGLKGVAKYTSTKKVYRSSTGTAPETEPKKGSTTAHTHTAHTPHTEPKARRTSMFDRFYSPAPAPAPTAPTGPSETQLELHSGKDFEDHEGDEGEEDEEDVMQIEMQRLKQQALVDCVSVIIGSVRAMQSKGRTHHRALHKNSALVRVFGHPEVSATLEVHLLYSGNPAAAPDSADSPSIASGLGSAFNSLFGSKPTYNRDSARTPSSPRAREMSPSDAPKDFVVVSGLQVQGLFYTDVLRKPHPFLTVSYGHFKVSTRVVEGSMSADWSADEPIRIPLSRMSMLSPVSSKSIGSMGSPDASLKNLVITLHYQGYFTASVIGSVSIPCPEYAPPVMKDARFIIEDYKSPQAAQAAKIYRESGRDLPSIRLSTARSSD